MIKTTDILPPLGFIEVSNIRHLEGYKWNRDFSQFQQRDMGSFFIQKESERLNMPSVVVIRNKGEYSKRYCSLNVFEAFCDWNINKVNPNNSEYLIRKEISFCKLIENTFRGVFTFKRQYKVLNYTVDLYCNELNLFIEFDENHHKYNIDKDLERELEIIKKTNCSFIRHNEDTDISITLNKIIKLLI